MKKKMRKSTKILFIIFGAGAVGMAVLIALILGTGMLASRDNADTIVLSEQIESIVLNTDEHLVTLVASNERKIVTSVNLWADEEIDVAGIAVVSTQGGTLTITQTPPTGKFLGLFAQPYELKITIYVPRDMIDDIDWSNTK